MSQPTRRNPTRLTPAWFVLLGAIHVACLALCSGTALADAELDRAIETFEAGRYEQAYEELEAALRRNPKSPDLQFYLGLTASRLGRSEESLASYRRVAELDPDYPAIQTTLGIALYQGGDLDEAETRLERAIEQDPSDGSAHLFLGLIHQDQGYWRESIDDFDACLEADPSLGHMAWFNIGRSHVALGDEASARAALEMSLALDSEAEMRSSAQSLLASLSKSGGRSHRWWFNAGIGYEYDDELTVSEVDFVSNVSDSAGVFDLSVGYVFPEWRRVEFETGYDFYQSVYSNVGELNLQTHSPHGSASWSSYGFTPTVGYYYTHSTLGGDGFLDLHRGRVSLSRLVDSWWYATLGWDVQGRVFEEQTSRDGVRNALVVENLFFLFERRFTGILNWRLESQNADASEFDFLGNILRMEIRGPLKAWEYEARFEIGYEFLDRNYDHDTPSIGQKREDRQHTFRLGLRAPIVRHLDAVFDYQYIDSDSNLPSQKYDENVVTLRAEVAF
jgi:tetratricopeptide (TPR) repeat protein